MMGIVVALLAVSTLGFAGFAFQSVRPEHGSHSKGPDGSLDSNLSAINALLAEERQQFRAVPTPIRRAEIPSPRQWSPGEQAGDSSSFPAAHSEDLIPTRFLGLFLPTAYPGSSQGAPHVQHLGPTAPPSADYSLRDWPVVPPYIFLAPAGSSYPGIIRCVPDYLGGQRCRSAP